MFNLDVTENSSYVKLWFIIYRHEYQRFVNACEYENDCHIITAQERLDRSAVPYFKIKIFIIFFDDRVQKIVSSVCDTLSIHFKFSSSFISFH